MKTILVTGAATGIGLAVSQALSAENYSVIAVAMPGQDTTDLRQLPHVEILEADLAHEEDIAQLIRSVKATGQLDGIISNAGIAVPGPVELVPIALLRLQYQVNTFAPIQIIQGLLPELRASKGRVIVIGAGQARASLPCGGPYGSSKAALAAVMDSLRAEIAPYGIRISIIEPGAVMTGILKSSEERWANMLAHLPHALGEDVLDHYRRAMEKSFAASARAFMTALQPADFAQFVVSVLNSKKPKPRYLVGKEARMLGFIAHLPGGLRASLMEKMV